MGHSLGACIAYVMAKTYRFYDTRQKSMLVVIGNEPIHCRKFFDFTESSEIAKDSLLNFANHLGQLLFPSPPERWQECTLQPFRLENISGGYFISEVQAHEISDLTIHFIRENKVFNI